jgi:hypothetical protein
VQEIFHLKKLLSGRSTGAANDKWWHIWKSIL